MKRFAIVGAGFSGLSLAWHLLCHPSSKKIKVTLFDPCIGGGASGMSAGLLHPFTGPFAKLSRLGKEGMKATLELLKEVSKGTSSPIFSSSGILRLSLDATTDDHFKAAKINYPELLLKEPKEMQATFPEVGPFYGLNIPLGLTVYPRRYLLALFEKCRQKGASLEKQKITHLKELASFDEVILCVGGGVSSFPELTPLNLRRNKGQLLECLWPKTLPPLSIPLVAHKYLVMDLSCSFCVVGSTFEKKFDTEEPDEAIAKQEILPAASLFFPQLSTFPIQACRAGIRVSTPTHLPFAGKIQKGVWGLLGMGSKGLLYHALFAKKLADDLL